MGCMLIEATSGCAHPQDERREDGILVHYYCSTTSEPLYNPQALLIGVISMHKVWNLTARRNWTLAQQD